MDPITLMAAVDEMQATRGQIISSYSQIEYLLADFCVRLSMIDEYKGILSRFPYKIEDRISGVGKLISDLTKLSEFLEEYSSSSAAILNFSGIRHMLAHGHCAVEHTKTEIIFVYRMYRPIGKDQIELHMSRYSLEYLRGISSRLIIYTTSMMTLFARMSEAVGIPAAWDDPEKAYGAPIKFIQH